MMQRISLSPLFLTGLCWLGAVAVGHAAGQARCDGGRFVLEAPLPLPDANESALLVTAQPDGTVALPGTTCGALHATIETAGKNTILKAPVESCAGVAPFTLKLRLTKGCAKATVTLKRNKKTVAQAQGAPSVCGDRVVDAGNGEACEPFGVVFCTASCDAIIDPKGELHAARAATAPRIDVVFPVRSLPGKTISVFGEYLDRRLDGTEGTPDYRVRFLNRNGLLSAATPP